jgi:hypothetical protein
MTKTIYTYQDLKDLVGALFLTLPVIFKPLLPPEMQAAERLARHRTAMHFAS